MVVQQGRLKDKDNKLSNDDLLKAVRFGADKIFKSEDSTITEDDIDLILDQGKKKTEDGRLKTEDGTRNTENGRRNNEQGRMNKEFGKLTRIDERD